MLRVRDAEPHRHHLGGVLNAQTDPDKKKVDAIDSIG